MPDHDPAIDDAVREIAKLLATAYLRLRFPDRASQFDSPETESPHVTEGSRHERRRDDQHSRAAGAI